MKKMTSRYNIYTPGRSCLVVICMGSDVSHNGSAREYFDKLVWRVTASKEDQGALALATLKPFKEGSVLGIEVEATDLFHASPEDYQGLVCGGFHECLGNFLKQEGANQYTGKLKVMLGQPRDHPIALKASSYAEGRIAALQAAFGETIFLEGKEYFGKVKQWSKQNPKAAKAIKWGLIAGGFAAAGIGGYFLVASLQNAAAQQGIMNANLQYKEGIELVRSNVIPPETELAQEIVNGNAAYDAAALAKDAAMTTAVFGGVVVGISGGASVTGIAVPARKVKIGEADRHVGLYVMARKNYIEESRETDKQILEVLSK